MAATRKIGQGRKCLAPCRRRRRSVCVAAHVCWCRCQPPPLRQHRRKWKDVAPLPDSCPLSPTPSSWSSQCPCVPFQTRGWESSHGGKLARVSRHTWSFARTVLLHAASRPSLPSPSINPLLVAAFSEDGAEKCVTAEIFVLSLPFLRPLEKARKGSLLHGVSPRRMEGGGRVKHCLPLLLPLKYCVACSVLRKDGGP